MTLEEHAREAMQMSDRKLVEWGAKRWDNRAVQTVIGNEFKRRASAVYSRWAVWTIVATNLTLVATTAWFHR